MVRLAVAVPTTYSVLLGRVGIELSQLHGRMVIYYYYYYCGQLLLYRPFIFYFIYYFILAYYLGSILINFINLRILEYYRSKIN